MLQQKSLPLDRITVRVRRPSTNKTYQYGKTMGEVFSLDDIMDWTEDSIRELAATVILDEVSRQTAEKNPPQELRVDGSLIKSLDKMNRNATVIFGGGVDARPAMKALTGAVTSGVVMTHSVSWIFICSNPVVQEAIDSGGPVYMKLTDIIYYVPRGGEAYVPYENILYKHGLTLGSDGRWLGRRKDRAGGFIGGIARRARSAVRPNFTVTARISNKRAPAVGRQTGLRNRVSPFTGKPAFYQGIWFFSLRRSLR